MTVSAQRVAAECQAWVWVPEVARTVDTPEYLLARFPDWFEMPAELLRFEPVRPAGEVLDEVLAHARELDAAEVDCWVKLGYDEALDALFCERGGVPDEVLDVLALDLAEGPPDLGALDPAVELRWEVDVDTARDNHRVSADVFGGSMPPDEELVAAAERGRADAEAGRGGTLVAYVDGVAVGSGGLSLVDGVARLWGGAVREEARGRGVYRALLGARLRYGLAHGASMALVKGRVQTSGPILRRAGFVRFGEERSYRVPVD